MTMTLVNGWVTLDDGAGGRRGMTLNQYAKHALDPAFVAAVKPADHAALLVMIGALTPADAAKL